MDGETRRLSLPPPVRVSRAKRRWTTLCRTAPLTPTGNNSRVAGRAANDRPVIKDRWVAAAVQRNTTRPYELIVRLFMMMLCLPSLFLPLSKNVIANRGATAIPSVCLSVCHIYRWLADKKEHTHKPEFLWKDWTFYYLTKNSNSYSSLFVEWQLRGKERIIKQEIVLPQSGKMLLNFNKIHGASEIFLFHNVADQRILQQRYALVYENKIYHENAVKTGILAVM